MFLCRLPSAAAALFPPQPPHLDPSPAASLLEHWEPLPLPFAVFLTSSPPGPECRGRNLPVDRWAGMNQENLLEQLQKAVQCFCKKVLDCSLSLCGCVYII